jgi:hypothetical protein
LIEGEEASGTARIRGWCSRLFLVAYLRRSHETLSTVAYPEDADDSSLLLDPEDDAVRLEQEMAEFLSQVLAVGCY